MKKSIQQCIIAGSLFCLTALFGVPALSAESNTTIEAPQKAVVVTRGDVKIIEATENIRYISQQMAKEYLFLFKTPYPEETKAKLKRSLIKLAENLRIIATTTKDTDTKDILEFLSYSKDQIAEIFTQEVTPEQAALMMDYSETLLEGADSIAASHAYAFTKEEYMLIVTKKMEYLLERVMKYYIALHVGFNNITNKEQMQEAIAKFDENIKLIEAYDYPKEIEPVEKRIVKGWEADKGFFARSDSLFIPKLMLLSTDQLEQLATQISLYHNKNQ